MPRRLFALNCILLAALMLCSGLTGCQGEDTGPNAQGVLPRVPAEPARKPVDAAHVLRDRLLAHDGVGFARLAVPPELHEDLAQGWQAGHSRWPLDELPLDAKLPKLLASLQEKSAVSSLMATFRRQFSGADRDIDQAIHTLVLFGGEYVEQQAEYSPEERAHIVQALAAVGDWGLTAPLSDPKRAQPFFTALSAAAQRSGIRGAAGDAAFATLGMNTSLARLSPFFATLLSQLQRQYGLDVDAALRSLKVTLQTQTGDHARLRLRYTLAGREIDALVPAVRINGRWYLADFVSRAEASLAPGAHAGTPASP